MRRPATVLSTITAGLIATACAAPTAPSPENVELGFGHVHGVDLNPADGLVYAATHNGVFRLGPDGPQRIADRYQDTMGFTIAGPDLFLGSGHPDPRESGPRHLGFITSTDQAGTWTSVALRGEADFHALSAAGTVVYGLDSTSGVIMRSDDGGANWQRGALLPAADLDVDPGNPLQVLATTETGLQGTVDGGRNFVPLSAQPPRPLVLLDYVGDSGGDREPTVVGIDAGGGVWALAAGGWGATGNLPGPPQAFTVVAADRYLAATEDGVLSSEDAGRTWSVIAASGA